LKFANYLTIQFRVLNILKEFFYLRTQSAREDGADFRWLVEGEPATKIQRRDFL